MQSQPLVQNSAVWSNFAENLKENINSSAEVRALESVVGNDFDFHARPAKAESQQNSLSTMQFNQDNSTNPNTIATSNTKNNHNNVQGQSSPGPNAGASSVLTSPNSASAAVSPSSSSTTGLSKEALKAEAQKLRAAKIDKNEAIEQRELITSYEEGAML